MVKPHNQSGQVSILDRVAAQAAQAAPHANPLVRGLYASLLQQVDEGFDWQDATVWSARLEAMTIPGEAVQIVSLKASLRAWAQLGADRAKAVRHAAR